MSAQRADGLPAPGAGGTAAGARTSAEAFLGELGGPRPAYVEAGLLVEEADALGRAEHHELRRRVFVAEQGLFDGTDRDDLDDHPACVVLVARSVHGDVVGGVRLAPVAGELGWWAGSRLVVAPGAPLRAGAALVRAACARAEAEGALRFDAVVQADKERFFTGLGWRPRGRAGARARIDHLGRPHVRMSWPIGACAAPALAKRVIGDVLGGLRPGGDGFVGDDAAPVPGSDLVAATDAIVPSMVERDPWWAGWCSVLVNANDLAAMGATPVGLLDSLAAPTPSLARRVMAGLTEAAERYGVPVLGGHTQVGVPAALSVTMLGRVAAGRVPGGGGLGAGPGGRGAAERPDGGPVPGGGGRVGDTVHVVADLSGGWRPGYGGRQWDSTTGRSATELRHMGATLQRVRPHAAKDVSMAGLVGTLAMLAEAGGCGAELDVAAVPRPSGARMADWLTCFPGFALVTAGGPAPTADDVAPATVAACGRLVADPAVTLVWPDGERTEVLRGPVVGLGPATTPSPNEPGA